MSHGEIVSVLVASVFTVIIAVWLKKIRPELSLAVSLAGATAIFLFVIKRLETVIGFLDNISDSIAYPEGFAIIIKLMSIAFIVQLIADSCRDAGENAIATKVELVGKAAIVITSLPLFKTALDLIVNVTE